MSAQEWGAGDAMLAAARPGHALQGGRPFVASRPDWHVSLLRSVAGAPGGPLTAALFGGWLSDVEVALSCGRFDAVYLSLDGAAQAEGDPIADTTVLRRVRAAVGRVPVVATFEVTANLSDEVPLLLDGATVRRGLGAFDPQRESGADAAERALSMLEAVVARRVRPIGAIVRLSDRVAFERDPTAARLQGWHDILADPIEGVLDASAFTGFAWSDAPVAGPSVLVWTDRDGRLAREAAQRVAGRLEDWLDDQPDPADGAPAAAPAAALAAALAAGRLPILLLDAADDPAAGGLCDTPELLRTLLALPAELRVAAAAWCDADAVAAAHAAGLGATLAERTLGAQRSWLFGAGVAATLRVVRLSDGVDGPAAVLQTGALAVLMLARRPRRIDRALLERCGLDLSACDVVAVKGGEAVRRGLAGWAAVSVAGDWAGPACADLLALPFRHAALARRFAGMRDGPPGAAAAVAPPRYGSGWTQAPASF